MGTLVPTPGTAESCSVNCSNPRSKPTTALLDSSSPAVLVLTCTGLLSDCSCARPPVLETSLALSLVLVLVPPEIGTVEPYFDFDLYFDSYSDSDSDCAADATSEPEPLPIS